MELSTLPYEDPSNSNTLNLEIYLGKFVQTTTKQSIEVRLNSPELEIIRRPTSSEGIILTRTEDLSMQLITSALGAAGREQTQNMFENWRPFKKLSQDLDASPVDLLSQSLGLLTTEGCCEETTPHASPKWAHEPMPSVDGASSLSRGIAQTSGLCSPVPMTRSTSVADSIRSFKSNDDFGDEWNTEKLLALTENIRETLKHFELLQNDADDLSELLEIMLLDEESASKAITLDVILNSRLDKVLAEIKIAKEMGTMPKGAKFEQIADRAGTLQQSWQRRFKSLWVSIDSRREKDLKQSEHIHGLGLDSGDTKNRATWGVNNDQGSNSDRKRSLGFSPGDWWFNIHCAFRDGIVGTTEKPVTKGVCGVTCLAMLVGEEVDGPTRGMYEYTRQGSWSDMSWSLMCHRRPIRVLRSSVLKSRYAPKAGIRYDGLYCIRQFGHKLLCGEGDKYQCTLILERVEGQVSVNDILKVPRPSQIDDWNLYKCITGDNYRAREGEEAYRNWKQLEVDQEEERIQWLNSRALEESFRKYGLVPRKASYLRRYSIED